MLFSLNLSVLHALAHRKRPTASKFRTEILENVFEIFKRRNFQKSIFSLIFYASYYFILRIFVNMWYSRPAAPKFGIEILKRDFEKTLKQFSKTFSRLSTGTRQNLKYFWGYKSLKN